MTYVPYDTDSTEARMDEYEMLEKKREEQRMQQEAIRMLRQQQSQQQQQSSGGGMNPMSMMDKFNGGGGATGGATGGETGGSGGSELLSNPYGWAAAMLLANNVQHNKGISSWEAANKGQQARNVGDYYLDKWDMNDGAVRDIAGILGWGSGGGWLNPSKLNTKIWGNID